MCSRFHLVKYFFIYRYFPQPRLVKTILQISCLYIKATKISVNKCEHIFFFHHLGIETWHFRGVSIKPALLNSRGANNVYI